MAASREEQGALALTPAEVVARTRIGRGKVYEDLRSGALRSIRIGRRIVVPVDAVTEWLEELSGRTPAGVA